MTDAERNVIMAAKAYKDAVFLMRISDMAADAERNNPSAYVLLGTNQVAYENRAEACRTEAELYLTIDALERIERKEGGDHA